MDRLGRIPTNGNPWEHWVAGELQYLHREMKAQREELKAQREELKAQRVVQRRIIKTLDEHAEALKVLARGLKGVVGALSELRTEIRGEFALQRKRSEAIDTKLDRVLERLE